MSDLEAKKVLPFSKGGQNWHVSILEEMFEFSSTRGIVELSELILIKYEKIENKTVAE